MKRYLCIHGHFYQPPRENPWLQTVEVQESAYPFHDWNERITSECYWPNARSRILDRDGYITEIVNNYARISFNFGPTLLHWMERARPDVYAAILDADRASAARFSGHGSALAQAYNHSILPLCTPRDRVTQVRWGIRDFETRFGRRPEGMWLPETAADTATLETLADEGLAFTILAPHQAVSVRAPGDDEWRDVSGGRIDPRRAYLAELPSGKSIALFFYDGPVSQAVAFERLLTNGDKFRARLMGTFDGRTEPQLVHIATDGETYGHHHRFGEMALAYALRAIEDDPSVALTNYGEFLERCPPEHVARISERTSWSCAHGIERWRSDCGCNSGGHPGWNQAWRAPLRAAFDALRSDLEELYVRLAEPLYAEPWTARDAYIDVILDRSLESVDRFLSTYACQGLTDAQRSTALKLVEMQRHAQLMYTSCAWFFDELSGIETVQCIRYAARAIQLAQQLGAIDVERKFVERLRSAKSNVPQHRDGARIYEDLVRPARVDFLRLVAHYAVSSLFNDYHDRVHLFAYHVDQIDARVRSLGRSKLAVGKVKVTSEVTLESRVLSYGILHLGDHNLSGGVREFLGDDEYERMREEVTQAFNRADMPEVLRKLDTHFLELTYSLRSLFRDEQRRVLDQIVDTAMSDAEGLSRRIYEAHSPLLRYLATLDFHLPASLRRLADFVLNTTLRSELGQPDLDHSRIRTLLEEAAAVGSELDDVGLAFALQASLEGAFEALATAPEQLGRLRRLRRTAELAQQLPFSLDLSVVQNRFWQMLESDYPGVCARAEAGDATATDWCETFRALGHALRIRMDCAPTPG